jgi:transcription antitermination factor NusG
MNTEPASRCWYALTVRPNQERVAANGLSCQGFETYLPVFKSCRRWTDRTKEAEAVLFPGYVFCRISFEDRLWVLRSPGVRSIVRSGRQAVPVSEDEIHSVRALVGSGKKISPWPYVHIGQRVVIRGGLFENIRGVVVRLKDAWRVVVSIDALGASLSVEIDPSMLCPDSEQVYSIAS